MKLTLDQWLWDQAAKAAAEWYAIQVRNLYAQLYLYYRRGELTVAENCPDGFTLGDGRRIGPSGTKEEWTAKIQDWARRIPCLPEEQPTTFKGVDGVEYQALTGWSIKSNCGRNGNDRR